MICSGCGNKKAFQTVSGHGWEFCDRCARLGAFSHSDVFWDGKEEHGLPDNPHTGKPMVFGSREEKARYLKKNNLTEAGDKVRGAPPSSVRNPDLQGNRNVSMEALQHVRNMGADVRRREINRILKENQR